MQCLRGLWLPKGQSLSVLFSFVSFADSLQDGSKRPVVVTTAPDTKHRDVSALRLGVERHNENGSSSKFCTVLVRVSATPRRRFDTPLRGCWLGIGGTH